jgi:pilus assembly protein CpaF
MTIPNQLQALLATAVTDVLISGPNNCLVDRGFGLERFELELGSESDLRRIAIELALGVGARVDIAKPIADFSIDNLRCQVVLPFGVSNQTLISIRKHPTQQVTIDHLVEAEMLTQTQSEFLAQAVLNRKTILIAGPTGAGKTTLLSALIHRARDRTIYIEQTPELSATFPAVGLLERQPNQEGVGAIDSIELLTHALRMRPDRLAIGEVRGREFGALLLAINNGHSAMATLHSQNLVSLPRRLNVLSHISGLDTELAAELLHSIDFVVQLSRDPVRKVEAFAYLRFDPKGLKAVPIEV